MYFRDESERATVEDAREFKAAVEAADEETPEDQDNPFVAEFASPEVGGLLGLDRLLALKGAAVVNESSWDDGLPLRLAGSDPGQIVEAAAAFLQESGADYPAIFGNGRAAHEILEVIAGSRWC